MIQWISRAESEDWKREMETEKVMEDQKPEEQMMVDFLKKRGGGGGGSNEDIFP